MKSLFLRILTVFLLTGALAGHAVAAAGHGLGSPVAGTASEHHQGNPAPHQDGDATLGFHCTVSASCLSVFTLAGPEQADYAVSSSNPWPISVDAARRPPILDRDPPIPRV